LADITRRNLARVEELRASHQPADAARPLFDWAETEDETVDGAEK
jgi:hypothetical protein